MPTAYGYARVSGAQQFREGLSLEHQESQAERYYQEFLQQDFDWGGMFTEGRAVSAYRKPFRKRPAGKQLAQLVGQGDIVIVTQVSRAFRSLKDLVLTKDFLESRGAYFCAIELCASGVQEVMDGRTPMGSAFLYMAGVFAEIYSRQLSERMRDCERELRRQGKRRRLKLGMVRDKDGYVREDKKIVALGVRACKMRAAGRSVHEIQCVLEREACQREDRPFRDSAFHNWFFTEDRTYRLIKMGQEKLERGTIL